MKSAPSNGTSGTSRPQDLRDTSAVSEHAEQSSDLAAELAELLGSFRSLISNAESVFSSVLSKPAVGLSAIGDDLAARFGAATQASTQVQDAVREQVSAAAVSTQAYVKENPWRVVAMAAAVSALIAYLMPRQR